MKRKYILIKLICLLPIFAFADVPIFDVVKVKINGEIIYMMFESQGVLKNGDFCYYNYQKEYEGEVKEVVYSILKDPGNYYFYKELHKINLKNIIDSNYTYPDILFVFKSPTKITAILNSDQVEIISAENGNNYGYTYSEDLIEKDNEWLTKYKIELLGGFEVSDGFCNVGLFAIEGAVSLQRKDALLEIMEKLSKDTPEKLQEELHKLYKQKIIMIGFCSC